MTGVPVIHLKVEADWGRNTLWNDVDADISSYVQSLSWRYGFTEPDQYVAPPSQAIITLNNSSGDWRSVGGRFSTKLKQGTLVRIVYDNTIIRRQLYVGKIVSIRASGAQYDNPTCVIELSDWLLDMQDTAFEPFMQTNVTTGVAIANQVFDNGLILAPYADSFWVLDGSALDSTTRLYINTSLVLVDAGVTALPYVGDNLDRGSGINARAFIEEMCAAELMGHFWYDGRTGGYIFRSRHSWSNLPRIAGINLGDQGETSYYTYGDLLVNDLNVTVYPRSVGTAGSVLYRSTSPIALAPGASTVVVARYRDPDNPQGSCGALTTIPLVAGTDYTVNTDRDGAGTDVSTSVVVNANAGRASAQITLSNPLAVPVWVLTLQVRGTPLTAQSQIDIKDNLPLNIMANGMKRQSLTIGSVGDVSLVREFADVYLRRRGKLRVEWRKWRYVVQANGSMLESLLILAPSSLLGRAVQVSNSWLSNPDQVILLGEEHEVDVASNLWRVTYTLEPFDYESAWVLDSSNLETGTIVAF